MSRKYLLILLLFASRPLLAACPDFLTQSSYIVGASPEFIATGDFNGDGNTDLAVSNSNSNNVSILLGNGDGTFIAAGTYAVGTTPFSIALADFNGDAQTDLAVA